MPKSTHKLIMVIFGGHFSQIAIALFYVFCWPSAKFGA